MNYYRGKPTQAYSIVLRVENDDSNDCWEPIGYVESNGYWKIQVNGKKLWAHRYSYEIKYGPIKHNIDHLCRNSWCWNPKHLEDVSQSENILRAVPYGTIGRGQGNKTHCVNGHEFTLENTRIRPTGARTCRTCARDWIRNYRKC